MSQAHFPARYYHLLEDGRIQCDLCPRECKMHDGQCGFCFVRKCEAKQMVLSTYGRSSGFCIDPIEKKPLNHFYPGSSVLSFGTAGCNLACRFCQNWDISKSRQFDRLCDQATAEMIVEAANREGCRSVAFTYNDPVIFLEYAVDVAMLCRAENIRNVAVTAGYIAAEARKEFFGYMDAVNVDLKAFSDQFYHRLCAAKLQPVLDTLLYLKRETDLWFEITTLLIPGENDSDAELHAMCVWIVDQLGVDVPLHFTAFHPAWKMVDYSVTPTATLSRARQIALTAGINYVYTGNVHDKEGDTTYCSCCHQAVIVRDWYEIEHYQLTNEGCCLNCQAKIAGVFGSFNTPFGRHRTPLHLDNVYP
ncbi:MAG: AmmeMemoRadiSam system radical SAM enzyme [Mariprofundus sp.]|nr:AmmeMemoRadiSam system radical SAM enzyme [Mariprofundus sp.]